MGAFWLLLTLATLALPLRAAVGAGALFPPVAQKGMVALEGGALPEVSGKVVLVDFWASWCGPCKASFPALARLHRSNSARGFLVVAVSVDEKPSAALTFWRRMGPPFPTLHDREQRLVRLVEVPTMPTSYLLDRAGRVRFVHAGFQGEATERELQRQIDLLLNETAPAQP